MTTLLDRAKRARNKKLYAFKEFKDFIESLIVCRYHTLIRRADEGNMDCILEVDTLTKDEDLPNYNEFLPYEFEHEGFGELIITEHSKGRFLVSWAEYDEYDD